MAVTGDSTTMRVLSPSLRFRWTPKDSSIRRVCLLRCMNILRGMVFLDTNGTFMDMATRARFTAYSYELSATFGFMFISLVLLWLRAHNVRVAVRIRIDNGAEFCGGSRRKLREWNRWFGLIPYLLGRSTSWG